MVAAGSGYDFHERGIQFSTHGGMSMAEPDAHEMEYDEILNAGVIYRARKVKKILTQYLRGEELVNWLNRVNR